MITIKNLCFSYGKKQIFSGLDLTLQNDITVLEGASGTGKTTLLKLVAGLLKPDAGEISGVPDKTAFLFQEDRLLPWLTAAENVEAVLPRERAADADKWMDFTELGREETRRYLENLSGGQRRRVAMARALAYGGALFILDEPMKGLDQALTARLIARIRNLKIPVLVTSHSEYEASLWGGEIVVI